MTGAGPAHQTEPAQHPDDLYVADRKREEQVRSRLAAIVESSDDAIIGKDLGGIITSWNRGAEAIYGYTPDEVVGKHISLLIPPEQPDELPAIMQRLKRGERIDHYETVRVRKDGQRLEVSVSISPVKDGTGTITGASAIARDISARRRAEEALRRQSERLRLLWEAAAVLMAADDPDALMRGLFGKVGRHLGVDTYLNFIVNETGDALHLESCLGSLPDEMARSIERVGFGQGVCGTVALRRQPVVATHIQQSDEPMVQTVKGMGLRVYACYPLLAENRLIGTLGFASRTRDQFDPDELEFLQTLSHYFAIAYDRLRLVLRLQQADRRKDEFLATLAHELRNPLAPLKHAVQIMGLANGNPEPVEQARIVMERQLGQMVRLVDDLLDVARISQGKLQLRKERVELATVVSNAVDAGRPLIEEMGHELTVIGPPGPLLLDGDPVRLTQVFLNLLNNAAKYTDRGGRIRLTVARQGSDAVVSVKDTGVGISPDKLPQIFEMFAQVDESVGRSQGGLGLGLTLVKRLTAMHGGSIEAKSDGPGQGSEFVVRLPLVSGPTTQDASSEAATAVARRRILVVDDNPDSAESLGMLLRIMGNKVKTAYDGIEAVQAAEAFKADVVLLDIGLPKLDGLEACRRIRAQPWGKRIMLVALTGWGHDEDRRRSLEAGFDAHMVKPVDLAALTKLLAGLEPSSA